MTCLTATSLLACLLDPSNLSIEVTAGAPVSGKFDYYSAGHHMPNPVWGRFAIKFQPQLTENLSLIYGWEHLSVINDPHDRGQERAFAGFIWTPFR